MGTRERHIEEIAFYKEQLGKTNSERRKTDLKKCIAKLERELKTYDNAKENLL